MNTAAAAPILLPSASLRRLQPLRQPRLFGLLFGVMAAGGTALLLILAMTGMSIATEFGKFVLLAAGVGGLAAYCHWRQHPWRLTDSAAAVSLVTLSLLLCGLVSCAGLRLGFRSLTPCLRGATRWSGSM